MSLAIRAIGTALPPTRLEQSDAAEVARRLCAETDEHRQVLGTLYRQTGVATRHMVFQAEKVRGVLAGAADVGSVFAPSQRAQHGPTTAQRMERYQREALPLAQQAAAAALAESGVRADEFTHLVTVSCTGFAAPGWDIGLIKQLGLPATVQRTHVGFMGCHGALNGLRVARAYAADPTARVLLVAVELCSLHYYYGWNPKKVVGNALFADGAAALVGVPAERRSADDWRATASGSCLFPDSEFAMTWEIGDHGFDMMLSTKVPGLIGRNLRPWLERWLGEHGLRAADVASWAVHPGGPRVLTGVEEALGLSAGATDVSREVLAECGNMSSPTVLFILERLRRRGAPRPRVALGFGPGLVVEGALFR